MARLKLLAGTALATLAGCGPAELDKEPVGVKTSALRPDTPGNSLQFAFDAGDIVENHSSSQGRFKVHYTRNGPNAVPSADVGVTGVPDFVEDVAETYESVLMHYETTLGFAAPLSDSANPDNGGDAAFDVYLVDFAGVGDGHFQTDSCTSTNPQQCSGFMVQENDFAGYGYPSTQVANKILCSHEFFHGVQAAYDTEQGSVFSEGSAVWATESFDDSLKDFEGFLGGYFQNPDRSLDVPLPGPVDPFSYGSAIFFQFLEERYGKGTVRGLWESVKNGSGGSADPYWLDALDPLLVQKGSSFAEGFADFATWNLMTTIYADPSRSYKEGKRYPRVKVDAVEAPYSDEKLRVFYASAQYYGLVPTGRAEMTAALVNPADTPQASEGLVLLLASRTGSVFAPVTRVADATAGTETIDTSGASEFIAVVVNTRTQGESARPGLCIGSVAEVVECRATLGGSGGAAGAGGSAGSAGTPTNPSSGDDSSGCGCRIHQSSQSLGWLWLLGLLSIRLLRRRRALP